MLFLCSINLEFDRAVFMDAIFAYEFDWNPITVEGYSEKNHEIIMVFNFDVTTEDKVKNVVQYVVGRTAWGYKNFPKDSKIKLSFDFRGQNITVSKTNSIKSKILELINNLNIDVQVSIDFLI